MATISPEDMQRVNDLRRRVLNNEHVTAEELNLAIETVRNARGQRIASSAAAAAKPKRGKLPPITSMDDISKLFETIGKKQ